MNSTRKQIILGAGVLGQSVAACLAAQGIASLMLSRSGSAPDGCNGVACDASDATSLSALLAEPATLYLCAAPAYWLWRSEFPALVKGIVAAAAGKDLHIVFADNVYSYGHPDGPFSEASASRPCSDKGSIRQQVAAQLMALDGVGKVRVAQVRAATFFGPGVEQSSVGRSVFESALGGTATYVIGDPSTVQAFTYVPDFAATMVRVAQDGGGFGQNWHAPSHNGRTLLQFLEQIAAHGVHPVKLRAAGPLMMRMLGLFNPAMRELREMLYLHDTHWAFSSELTERTFRLAATPLATAIAQTAQSVQAAPAQRLAA